MEYYNGNMMPQLFKKEKKSLGFVPGFLIGLVIGIVILGIGTGAAVKIYTTTANRYLVVGPGGVSNTSGNSVLDKATVNKIEELMTYVDVYYNDEYDEEDIRDYIYKGTLSGLGDPYSVYYTADEYKELQLSTSGNYCGIGALLAQDAKTMRVTVSKVYAGTPAEEAGVKDGDEIVKVEQYEATSMELSSLVKMIRGEDGTTVHLQIYRESTGETLELDVGRRDMDLPSVESQMLEGGIGYIQITEFQSKTAEQFQEALKELQKQDMQGLIVDVRNNPGGLITSVVDILDQILPEGTVVYTEDKYGKRDTYTSDKVCLECPIAVLVDGNSASASEILAGAIKDYQYGTLIGTKTFGKGIVQTIYPLGDGSAIKITTAKYYTPDGNYIHEVGIEPDIELDYEYQGEDVKSYDMKYDNQVQKAVEVLSDQISQ